MAPSGENQSIVSLKDLKFVLRIARDNWWVPLIFLPLSWALAYFYSYKLTNLYKISSEILLQNNDYYYKSSVISENVLAAAYIDNANEQRVIKSYDLVKSVLEKLRNRLQVSYFIVGKVRTTEQFIGMPFQVEVISISPSLYETIFDFRILNKNEFLLKYDEGEQKKELKGRFGEQLITELFSFKINFFNADKSEKEIQNLQQIFYQFIVHSDENLIGQIRSGLKVENPEYTNFLVISMEDILPERSKLILDSLIAAYIYNRVKVKYEMNEKTILYIDKQLDEISRRLKESLDTLMDYKRNKSILNLSWQESSSLSRISKLDEDISQVNLQLGALDDLEKYIIENKDPQFLPPNAFVFEKDGYMNKAVQELYNKQMELNRMLLVAKPENPTVIQTKDMIKQLKNELMIYIYNTRNALKNKKENLYQEMSKYMAEAKNIDPKQQDINQIQRLLKVNESIYNFLLEKRANTMIARASIVPDVKVVESPRNFGVIWPDRNAINKRFLSFGLGISLLIIIIRSLWFTRIKTLDHLKELTNLPVLGLIPKVKANQEQDEFYVFHSPNSMVSESFRSVAANLQFATVGKESKIFLFTSYMPSEGKTFVSLNMAGLKARAGKKTILLELDLHRPRVYKALGLGEIEKGLSNYLSNQSSLEEIIYHHPKIDNLHIIFTGPVPPNPSDYIISEKLKELIFKLREEYDYIIFDTPPCGILSDSVYLMQFADVPVFVINSEKSSHREIQFINQLVKNNNLSNAMIILNAVKIGLRRYYYSGYGYSYGYGYGYGYGQYNRYKQ